MIVWMTRGRSSDLFCAVLCTAVKHSRKAYSYEQYKLITSCLGFLTTRKAVWFIIFVDSVCLHVCQMITFERFDAQSLYLHIWCTARVKFICIKVIESRSRSKEHKCPQCVFPQGKTACQDNSASPQIENPIANNSTFITHTNDTAVEFACSI